MIHICRRGVPVEGGSPECHRRAREVKTGGREVANIVGAADIKRMGPCWKAKSSVKKDRHSEEEYINEREVGIEVVAMGEIQREMGEELSNVRMENLRRILLLNF